MWMKNTYISLDMIFIRADGRILRIAENTTPESEAIISCRRTGARRARGDRRNGEEVRHRAGRPRRASVVRPALKRRREGRSKIWSGRQDSNLRPSAPKADALPDCATPRRLQISDLCLGFPPCGCKGQDRGSAGGNRRLIHHPLRDASRGCHHLLAEDRHLVDRQARGGAGDRQRRDRPAFLAHTGLRPRERAGRARRCWSRSRACGSGRSRWRMRSGSVFEFSVSADSLPLR